jgi:formylglycine-generating enzyme required for sulfatase activity
MDSRALKIFLCYSSEDKAKVRELYGRLVLNGFDVWFDETRLLPGQDWDLEIRKTVREADVILVFLSNISVSKAGYAQKEIRLALDVADEQPEGAIFLIPLRIENCTVPIRLNKWQWVDLFAMNGYQKLLQALDYRAQSIGISRDVPNKPNMICIPAGQFLMGSTKGDARNIFENSGKRWHRWLRSEQPQHVVELSEYWISKYLVTNREYYVFIKETGTPPPENWTGYKYPLEKGNHPVVYVSWKNATAYCRWLTANLGEEYRLPTEAEWEKAARGVNANIFPWGNEFDSGKANTIESLINDTSPVGQFSPEGDSAFGCADMAGNVYEWCLDYRHSMVYAGRNKLVKDPYVSDPNPTMGRVIRGGCFGTKKAFARCAYRTSSSWPSGDIGFRVVSSKIHSDF